MDNTVDTAKKWGAHHVVNFRSNRGLAKGFLAGLDACLRNGADIIVNTDADNQYCGADIEALIRPILEGKADMVSIGERPIGSDGSFFLFKEATSAFWKLGSAKSFQDRYSGCTKRMFSGIQQRCRP